MGSRRRREHQTNGFTFIVNGKADGHAVVDAPTQVMGGMLAALLHGKPSSALIVGLGTGSTAGWLGAIPSVGTVDVVELEPAILRVARECAPVNRGVLDNPKVHVHLADAREFLRTTKERYDIIFSEPSNRYRAGISSLYTVEYYRAAAERVAPGVMFVQWLQAYEVDGWVLGTAVITLRQAFADVEIWRTMGGDLVLIARATHDPIDIDRLRATMLTEPYASAVGRVSLRPGRHRWAWPIRRPASRRSPRSSRPPWVRSVIKQRSACYSRNNDPRAELAKLDELAIIELDLPLGSSIPTPKRASGQAAPTTPVDASVEAADAAASRDR